MDRITTAVSTPVVIGTDWTVTLRPQATRVPGPWVLFLRSASVAGAVVDLGLFLFEVPAGSSELLVDPGAMITNFSPPGHDGGGSSKSFSAAVPVNCALIGSPWFAQAMVFGNLPAGGGVFDPWFSSAVQGVIGNY